jgi:hypothetical protein
LKYNELLNKSNNKRCQILPDRILGLTKRITARLCQINALKFEKRLFTNCLQQLEFATYCRIEKQNRKKMYKQVTIGKEQRRHNRTYKKLAVQWLNEGLCFISSFVVEDSLVLRNRQLLVAANRCVS